MFRVLGLNALSALLRWFVPGFDWDGRYVLVLVEGCGTVCWWWLGNAVCEASRGVYVIASDWNGVCVTVKMGKFLLAWRFCKCRGWSVCGFGYGVRLYCPCALIGAICPSLVCSSPLHSASTWLGSFRFSWLVIPCTYFHLLLCHFCEYCVLGKDDVNWKCNGVIDMLWWSAANDRWLNLFSSPFHLMNEWRGAIASKCDKWDEGRKGWWLGGTGNAATSALSWSLWKQDLVMKDLHMSCLLVVQMNGEGMESGA